MAEDSPNLPLKALHPLLEDGTEGRKADEKDFSDLVKLLTSLLLMITREGVGIYYNSIIYFHII